MKHTNTHKYINNASFVCLLVFYVFLVFIYFFLVLEIDIFGVMRIWLEKEQEKGATVKTCILYCINLKLSFKELENSAVSN